jgi:hypothetical protein
LSIPFTKARELSVLVPQNDNGNIDIYIDDSIGIAPDIGDTPSRVSRAIPLAIWMLSRPLSDNDVIPRRDMISLKKLHAEGQMSEIKTILGWSINTKKLIISLPDHKTKDWHIDINKLMTAKKASFQSL